MLNKITIIIFTLISFVIAQDYAGYAGNFLHNGPDARSIAMGNGLTAGTNLNFPAYFNPAGVAAVSNKKVSFSHQILSLDRRQSMISFTTPLPPVGGVSIGWIGAGVNDIDGRDLSGMHTNSLSSSENAFLISFGITLIQQFQIGGTVKILQIQLPNIDGNINGNGVGFDFGILYNLNKKLNVAITLQNINAAYQWSNKLTDDLGRLYKDKFPLQLRVGSQYQLNSLVIAGDAGAYFSETESLGYDYRIGIEYIYNNNYYFRSGLRNNKIAFGIGLKYNQFDKLTSLIDYAIVIESVTSPTHIISYAINF